MADETKPRAKPEVEEQWRRYVYMRDNGHTEFVKKAQNCDAFYRGEQWMKEDLDSLKEQGKPALTINKIMPTINLVMGEQATNRAEVMFKPREDGDKNTAEILSKVYMQVSDNNKLDWIESEVLEEGLITSRGFYDVRIEYDDHMRGDIVITSLNAGDVIIDPDASCYDPKDWQDVLITRWMSLDDIDMMYGKDKADELRNKSLGDFNFGSDSVSRFSASFKNNAVGFNDLGRFTGAEADSYLIGDPQHARNRRIRVIERQHRKITNSQFFVDPNTGDTRMVPDNWDAAKIKEVAAKYKLGVIRKRAKRVRWTVTADTVLLHDDWSPYDEFTVVPYFPFFRHGYTVGLVENLRSSQELLNKATSQELHIINTTANSGYDVEEDQLVNMTSEELEQKGAKTGVVIVRRKGSPPVVKIQPNQIPSGMDRMSMRAEDFIKEISAVSDSLLGFDREDVSGRAIQAKQARGSVALARALDNLQRTRHMLAARVLCLVQQYYTEERVINITGSNPTNPAEVEEVTVNQVQDDGSVLYDLTVGKYDVVISSVPAKDTFQDGQFEEAMRMREAGIQIDDATIIEQSHLSRRNEIASELRGKNQPSEAEQRTAELENAKTEAEIEQKRADAQLTMVRAQKEANEAPDQTDGGQGEIDDAMTELEHEHEMHKLRAQMDMKEKDIEFQREKLEKELETQVLIAAMKLASDEEKESNKTALGAGKLELEREKAKKEASKPAPKAVKKQSQPQGE